VQLQNNIWETGSKILNSVEYHFFPTLYVVLQTYATIKLEASLQHEAGGSVVKKTVIY